MTWKGRELGIENGWLVIGPLPTWAVNPTKKESDFGRFRQQNPLLFEARYCCRPQLSVNPLFPDPAMIDACFTNEGRARVRTLEPKRSGPGWKAVWEISGDLLRPIPGAQYVLAVDWARSKDRVGIAMAHVSSWDTYTDVSSLPDGQQDKRESVRPRVKLDFTTHISPDMTADPPRPVYPADVYTLLRYLVKKLRFPIRVIVTDQYGFQNLQEALSGFGAEVVRFSIDSSGPGEGAWLQLADLISTQRLTGPYDALLVTELKELTRNARGKVDHPVPHGSKDVADAVASAVHVALQLGGQEQGNPAAPGFDFGVPINGVPDMQPLSPGGADGDRAFWAGMGAHEVSEAPSYPVPGGYGGTPGPYPYDDREPIEPGRYFIG